MSDASRTPHRQTFEVRWADLDANRHLRNTAYDDYATHVRFGYLARNGFPPSRFAEVDVGPVVFRQETRFRREVLFGERVEVTFRAAGLSADGSRWRVHHEFVREDAETAAILRLEGAWMDLVERSLVAPPPDLLEALVRLGRTEDFEELPSVLGS